MENVFVAKGASAHCLNILAEWIREAVAKTKNGELDVIKFVEVDLPVLFPSIYLHVEDDIVMGNRRAFISDDPLGIVVSESIYEGAANGCLFSSEVILHEVGHILLHHKYSALSLNNANAIYKDRIRNTNLANSAEWQATLFAICLLYPYNALKSCNDSCDVMKMFRVTRRQADRVLGHLRRLRSRENSRNHAQESRWLTEIKETLSEKRKEDIKPLCEPIQLSLFTGAHNLGIINAKEENHFARSRRSRPLTPIPSHLI